MLTSRSILLAVKRNINHVGMAFAFLVDIYEAGQLNNVSEDVAHAVFKDFFPDLAGSIKIDALRDYYWTHIDLQLKPSYSFQPDDTVTHTTQDTKDKTNGQRFALLLCDSLSLGLDIDVHQMVLSLIKELGTYDYCNFDSVYHPAFEVLGPLLQGKKYPVQNSSIASLIRSILITHIAHYVEAEPVPSDFWVRGRVGCACKDCAKLNEFLDDSTQHVWRFTASQARRAYVQKRISNRGEGYNIETERYGSPFTMVVTKNKLRYFRYHEHWVSRRDHIRKKIEAFDQHFLRLCLGEEYDAIASVKVDVILPAQETLMASVQTSVEKDPPSRDPSPISKRKFPAPADSSKKSPKQAQG
jgi:hypothetical protein